jgi:hypothetical protein
MVVLCAAAVSGADNAVISSIGRGIIRIQLRLSVDFHPRFHMKARDELHSSAEPSSAEPGMAEAFQPVPMAVCSQQGSKLLGHLWEPLISVVGFSWVWL